MLREEMTKREITDLVVSKVTQNMQSADFEKKVKEIASKVVEELFKILWIKRAFWKNDIKK